MAPDEPNDAPDRGEPTCCGQPMRVVEYDSDDDAYLYACEIDPQSCPTRWFETDDEVWK